MTCGEQGRHSEPARSDPNHLAGQRRTALEAIPYPVFLLRVADRSVTYANQAACPDGLSDGLKCYALAHGRSTPCSGPALPCPLYEVCATGRPVVTEHRIRQGGEERRIQVHAFPVLDERGQVVELEHILIDVTCEAELRRRLEETDRLEAIGRLAGGVAHELNTLLMAILWPSELMLADIGPRHPLRAGLEQVHASGERVASLVRQLLAFGRRQSLRPGPIDLNARVTSLWSVLRRAAGEHTALDLRLGDDAGMVLVDAEALERVLVSLVLNAGDAMPRGGLLAIETRREHIVESLKGAALNPGDYAVLTVRDTGCGVPPEVLTRIFEPFFTTKEPGGGIGLGLPAAEGFAAQSGGAIRVTSAPGRGSAFQVYLPRIDSGRTQPP